MDSFVFLTTKQSSIKTKLVDASVDNRPGMFGFVQRSGFDVMMIGLQNTKPEA